jgi:hypothetical protein
MWMEHAFDTGRHRSNTSSWKLYVGISHYHRRYVHCPGVQLFSLPLPHCACNLRGSDHRSHQIGTVNGFMTLRFVSFRRTRLGALIRENSRGTTVNNQVCSGYVRREAGCQETGHPCYFLWPAGPFEPDAHLCSLVLCQYVWSFLQDCVVSPLWFEGSPVGTARSCPSYQSARYQRVIL